jgi:hypothetical protein
MEALVYKYYIESGQLDDIATIGSSMALAIDANMTLDPAYWYDWLETIDGKKRTGTVKFEPDPTQHCTVTYYHPIPDKREMRLLSKNLTMKEGYQAAIRFLNKYADLLSSKAIRELIAQLTFDKWTEAASKIEQSK